MSDPKIIRTDVIPSITEVRLYRETIEKVRDSHPEIPAELPCVIGAVESTLVSPSYVAKSYGASYVYVNVQTTNHSGDPLRVPVKIVEGTSGRVQSFYFASKDDENVVWGRTDG